MLRPPRNSRSILQDVFGHVVPLLLEAIWEGHLLQNRLDLPRRPWLKVVAALEENFPDSLVAKGLSCDRIHCRHRLISDDGSDAWFFAAYLLASHRRVSNAAALRRSEQWLSATLCSAVLPREPFWVCVHHREELAHR